MTVRKWVRPLAALADPLAPQIEIKTFAPQERDQALAWGSDVKAEAEPA